MSAEKPKNMFWPDLSTIEKAEGVAKKSAGIPLFISCITALVAIYGHFFTPILGITLWALIDAFLFALIAFGMFRINRVVSILGLAFYVWSQFELVVSQGTNVGVLVLFLLIIWVNGIRAAFKFHSMKKQTAGNAQEPNS